MNKAKKVLNKFKKILIKQFTLFIMGIIFSNFALAVNQSKFYGIGLTAIFAKIVAEHFKELTLEEYFADQGIDIVDDNKGTHLLIPTDILFRDPMGKIIDARYYPVLNKIVSLLNENPEIVISISGNTDNILPKEKRYPLSEEYAKAVSDYLLLQGIDGERIITVKGNSDSSPVATNNSMLGRALNRRVEISLLTNETSAIFQTDNNYYEHKNSKQYKDENKRMPKGEVKIPTF